MEPNRSSLCWYHRGRTAKEAPLSPLAKRKACWMFSQIIFCREDKPTHQRVPPVHGAKSASHAPDPGRRQRLEKKLMHKYSLLLPVDWVGCLKKGGSQTLRPAASCSTL